LCFARRDARPARPSRLPGLGRDAANFWIYCRLFKAAMIIHNA
jgi:hypothetical protein